MRIIICGPGSAGKDLLKKRFEDKGFVKSISYTTRPPRTGEADGDHYHFVDEETFFAMRDNNEFLEWQSYPTRFNGSDQDVVVYYGTTVKHFEQSNIFIMTPSGIADLTPKQRSESMIIYLDVPEEIRRNRLSKRHDGDDVETRLQNDRKDFENFVDFDLRIENSDF